MSIAYEAGFARGLRACVEMLETMSDDTCVIVNHAREVPQENMVRRVLAKVLMRGDAAELDGFCAGLTELAACADQEGDFSRGFAEIAESLPELPPTDPTILEIP